MRIETRAAFDAFRKAATTERERARKTVLVCCGTGCLANGSAKVAAAIREELGKRGLTADLGYVAKQTGCHGCCQRGPLVVIEPAGTLYIKVKPEDAAEIVGQSVAGDDVVERLLDRDPAHPRTGVQRYADVPFYRNQTRLVLGNIGRIDPGDIRDAVAVGAYGGLVHAVFDMAPADVVAEIDRSGLRGRGGAGFPTGRKWRSCREAAGDRKLVICNGDEGDPGAFKDRSIMEGDPHSVLEGLTIGAYAIGAHEGYVYVRDEYPLAVTNLTRAIEQAREHGFLGRHILGTDFDFDVRISRGGGAFVCGESSALMLSLEGRTGEPRAKHIHATTQGLFKCPTVLNNVETWTAASVILRGGAAAFGAIGTPTSRGTKAFSLVGKVERTGLVELPMGSTLRHVVYDIGGGVLGGRPLKAVQTGGPSGGCVPASLVDLPVDYERLTEAGSMMGSGGLIVMDDRTCMVDVARYFLKFLVEESCGKCTPCREGLQQMLAIYEDIVAGRGRHGDVERIERLASAMKVASLCELGKSAPNPVLSTLRYFREEYDAHVERKTCPAGTCQSLTVYSIDREACNGCHVCVAACPAGAISGQRKTPHVIDPVACLGCGACYDVCRPAAVRFGPRAGEAVV